MKVENITPITSALVKGVPTRRITTKTNLPKPADQLPGADDPIDYLIEGMLEKHTFNSIIAAPKAGKTSLSIQMAFCVQNGIPFLGYETHQCHVLYVDCEHDARHINQRVNMVKEFYNFPGGESPKFIPYGNDFSSDGVSIDKMVSDIRSALKSDPEIGLVICDCFYMWCKGGVNIESNVKAHLTPLKQLVAEYGICLNYVHHTTKASIKKDPTANDIINAGGGSGVHGRNVNTAFVIYPKGGGLKPTSFVIAGVGRSNTIDAIACENSEETYKFFLNNDENAQEIVEAPAGTREIADYIKDNGVKDLRSLTRQFGVSIDDLRERGFIVDSKNHKIAFNEADPKIPADGGYEAEGAGEEAKDNAGEAV